MSHFDPASILLEGITGSTAYGLATPDSDVETCPQLKLCKKCGDTKPLTDFFRSAKNADGRHYVCRDCDAVRRRLIRRENPEKFRAMKRVSLTKNPRIKERQDKHRMRVYGVSRTMWEALFKMQGGKCAICRMEPAVVVDHDHKADVVRGLLCNGCNLGLGHFKDDEERLKQAVDYLEQVREREGQWSNDRRESVADKVLNHMRPDSPLRPYDDAAHG